MTFAVGSITGPPVESTPTPVGFFGASSDFATSQPLCTSAVQLNLQFVLVSYERTDFIRDELPDAVNRLRLMTVGHDHGDEREPMAFFSFEKWPAIELGRRHGGSKKFRLWTFRAGRKWLRLSDLNRAAKTENRALGRVSGMLRGQFALRANIKHRRMIKQSRFLLPLLLGFPHEALQGRFNWTGNR